MLGTFVRSHTASTCRGLGWHEEATPGSARRHLASAAVEPYTSILKAQLLSIALAADGQMLFTGDGGASAIAWQLATGTRVRTLNCDGAVHCLVSFLMNPEFRRQCRILIQIHIQFSKVIPEKI